MPLSAPPSRRDRGDLTDNVPTGCAVGPRDGKPDRRATACYPAIRRSQGLRRNPPSPLTPNPPRADVPAATAIVDRFRQPQHHRRQRSRCAFAPDHALMAMMIPSSVKNFHGSKGEENVFLALRALPDEVTVLHSFRW